MKHIGNMSDGHSHYLPGTPILSVGSVAVWIGKGPIPKGWRKMTKKETELYIKGRLDQIKIDET